MRTRWRINKAAAVAFGAVWIVAGFVALVVIAAATGRHSPLARIAVAVYFSPICLALFGGLLAMVPDLFGVRPSFGWLWRREREPVLKDLRDRREPPAGR